MLARFAAIPPVAVLLLLSASVGAQPATQEPPPPAVDAAPVPVDAGPAAAPAPAPTPVAATAPPPAPAEPELSKTPPDKAGEVHGTCKTPRQAWLQLLHWLQQGTRWQPNKAAACFDMSGLPGDEAARKKRAAKLAEQLKEAVDSRGANIKVDRIPWDPNYVDPEEQLPRYENPVVAREIPGIYVVKIGDRWLFSRDTLDRVPDLVGMSQTIKEMMPDWMRGTFLGVESWSYLGVLLLIFLALLVQKLTVFVVGTYLRRLVGQTDFKYLDRAIRRADRPIGGLAMALVFYLGFPLLLFPVRISQLAMIATEALAAYSAVWLAYRLIDVIAEFLAAKAEGTDTKLDDQLVPLVRKTLKVFVSVVGGIFILQNLDVNVGSLLAGLGLGGLAFALAAKDTVANFFGSVMIFIDKPFQIGDWVVMKEVEGMIEEVGFRTSKVRTFYNSVVTVPNSLVVNSTIDNYGRRQFRRYVTTLGITYDTPVEKLQAFCEGVRGVIAGMPGMRKDYYLVEFKDFGASALEIMLYCFMVSPSWNEELRTRTRLNMEILRLAREVGVSFAYPTQTLHIETAARPGESRPAWSGSTDPEELAGVVRRFGPGGESAMTRGFPITDGYYCDGKRVAAGDGGGEG